MAGKKSKYRFINQPTESILADLREKRRNDPAYILLKKIYDAAGGPWAFTISDKTYAEIKQLINETEKS